MCSGRIAHILAYLKISNAEKTTIKNKNKKLKTKEIVKEIQFKKHSQ